MEKLSKKVSALVPIFSSAVAMVSLITVFGFIGLEAYIRWTVNQDFTFVGGYKLEVLTISAFVLLAVLLLPRSASKREK
jgi:hypothetical protein